MDSNRKAHGKVCGVKSRDLPVRSRSLPAAGHTAHNRDDSEVEGTGGCESINHSVNQSGSQQPHPDAQIASVV
eukprot:3573530-Amphidinium_carterae.1